MLSTGAGGAAGPGGGCAALHCILTFTTLMPSCDAHLQLSRRPLMPLPDCRALVKPPPCHCRALHRHVTLPGGKGAQLVAGAALPHHASPPQSPATQQSAPPAPHMLCAV